MRLTADRQRCDQHGLCFVIDDELFPLDEDGRIAYGPEGVAVPPGKESLANAGVDQCPVLALRIES